MYMFKPNVVSYCCFIVAAGKVKLSNFWITDSLPHAHDIAQHPPFKLLSLAGEIKNMLEKETFW